MSRAWMPIYWGDYLRDTRDLTTLQHGAYLLLIAHYWQHEKLPTDEGQLAAIAGVGLKTWRTIQGPIAGKFGEGWTHKRIDAEIIKAERKQMQRALAGQKGGRASGLSRSVATGQDLIDNEAKAKRSLERERSKRSSETEASGQAKTKLPGTNHISNITTSSLPRGESAADPPVHVEEKGPPKEERKRPDQVSSAELEAMFAAKREVAR